MSKILYIKNLNFITTENDLKNHFENYNLLDINSVKIVKDKQGQSKGYAFIEFRTQETVKEALKKVQNTFLHDHALKLSVSHQETKTVASSKKTRNLDLEATSKIVIRNLAFECTRNEVRELVKTFGEVKAVRLPKKLDGNHRYL